MRSRLLIVAACVAATVATVIFCRGDRVPPSASSAGVRPLPIESPQRAVGMTEPRDPRSVQGRASTFWIYAVGSRSDGVPDPDAYRLVGSGQSDIAGERIGVRAADAADLTSAQLDAMLAARSSRELVVRAFEGESDQRLAGLLVDGAGRPLGPIDRTDHVLGLMADSAWYVLAHGYVAARVVPLQPTNLAFARLRRAAYATGRVGGAPFAGGGLWVYDLGHAQDQCPPTVVAVDDEGRFALGPVAVGPKQLGFQGAGAWLAKAHRNVELVEGRQDLGLLMLERLHALHLRVSRAEKTFSGELYVSIHTHGKEMEGLAAFAQRAADGRVVVGPYPGRRLAVSAWTADGWFGTGPTDGVLAEETSAGQPLPIALAAPGSLFVRVSSAPFGIPSGSTLLIAPTAWHRQRQALLRDTEPQPVERVRRAIVLADGVVEVNGLWPTTSHLALVSTSGAVLATSSIEVPAGGLLAVDLAPQHLLAALDFVTSGLDSRRFAVLSETDGIVLRGAATRERARFLIAAGNYAVHELEAGCSRVAAHISLAPGEVEVLELR